MNKILHGFKSYFDTKPDKPDQGKDFASTLMFYHMTFTFADVT